jgi:hypothetical protein
MGSSFAQDVIDIAINGISENKKDGTQRDKQEAIMNAESLMDRGEERKACEIIKKYVNDQNEDIAAEATYYQLKWGFVNNFNEAVEKFITSYPSSKYTPILVDVKSKRKLLVYNQTLSLNLKCLRPNTIYTYESRLIPFWNISENMNSLRFSFYFEVKYKWDKYHRKSYAALYITAIQVVLSDEQFKLEKPDQMGRIYLSFPGTFKYEFKNDIFGDFEFRGANMEVDGKYDHCEYDLDGDKLYFLSCDKAKFSFEIFQNKW